MTRGLGPARRYLALVTLLLFAHAVALHLLHGRSITSTGHACSDGLAISAQTKAPADSQHTPENCPACQLQHGFALLEAASPALILDTMASVEPVFRARTAESRMGLGPASSRAPPAA